MNKRLHHSLMGLTHILCVFVSISVLTSCINTRKTTYFNDIQDSQIPGNIVLPASIIRSNDILSIIVTSANPDATQIFNTPVTPSANGNFQSAGYLVDEKGFIQFPQLGNIKAGGLTTIQLKDNLIKSLVDKKLLIDPIMSVRFQNFRVTVLGEVRNPAVIPVPSEKISLLEAIGLAGDITIYGKKENVLLIREDLNGRTIKRLNLNSTELFQSPYYFLQSNDVIYVEANKAKIASSSRSQQWLPIVLGSISILVIALDRLIQ